MADNSDILEQDWAALSPEKKAQFNALIGKLDGAKLYQSAGKLGIGDKSSYDQVAAVGGLPQDQLTALARYKMFQNLTGGDPNWQGPTQIPTGARTSVDTPDDVKARGAYLASADPDQRAKSLNDSKLAVYQSQQGHYDSLANPSRQQRPEIAVAAPKAFLAKEQQTSLPDVPPPATEDGKLGAGLLTFLQSLVKGK